MKNYIIPAIIAKSNEEMQNNINRVKEYVEMIQLDVMDGAFVANKSLDFELELPEFDGKYEAHLMVVDPAAWIDKNHALIRSAIVHFETIKEDPEKIIRLAREKSLDIAFAINPDTTVDEIRPYLDKIDYVLVMTVVPGQYGALFVPEAVDKIRQIKRMRPELPVEVDGSINDTTIDSVKGAGASMFCSGSFIVKADDPKVPIQILKDVVDKND